MTLTLTLIDLESHFCVPLSKCDNCARHRHCGIGTDASVGRQTLASIHHSYCQTNHVTLCRRQLGFLHAVYFVTGAVLADICVLAGWKLVILGRRLGGVCIHQFFHINSLLVHPTPAVQQITAHTPQLSCGLYCGDNQELITCILCADSGTHGEASSRLRRPKL